MIQVSDAFKAAMQTRTNYTISATVTLADQTVLSLGAGDFCIGNNSYTDSAGANSLPVGAALCRTIQIELMNDADQYADVSFSDAVVRLYLLLAGESVDLGRFTVLEPETYGETVIITAQDDMYKADKPFATALTYPATAAALWAEICSACGLANGMEILPAGSFQITEAPSSEHTYRAVLGYIAGLSGGNARISRAGEIEVVGYDFAALAEQREAQTAERIHDLTAWANLKSALNDAVITGVQFGDVLEGSEGYVLNIENPLIAGQEQSALETIGAALIGGRFRVFSGDHIAYPLAEFGDGCRLRDRKGNYLYSVITDVHFGWTDFTTLKNSAEPPLRSASYYTPPDTRAVQAAKKYADEAAKTATNYIAEISDGIMVFPAGGGAGYVHITSNGMDVYAGGDLVASFGGRVYIGRLRDAGDTQILLAPERMSLMRWNGASIDSVFDVQTSENNGLISIDLSVGGVEITSLEGAGTQVYGISANNGMGTLVLLGNVAIGDSSTSYSLKLNGQAITPGGGGADPSATTPLMDGTAAVGSETAYARGDHRHPTDTTRAPNNHRSSGTTYGVGNASYYGHLKLIDDVTSTLGVSGGTAAAPNSVRAAYQLASDAYTLADSKAPQKIILWTNPSPSAAFAAQLIAKASLPSGFADCNLFTIIYRDINSEAYQLSETVYIPSGSTRADFMLQWVTQSGSTYYSGLRVGYVDTSEGIRFYQGRSGGLASNYPCVPVYIIGETI